jgi:TonB family protein
VIRLLTIVMLSLIALSRVARSQPADAGVDAPADAPADAPPVVVAPVVPDTPPTVGHHETPIYPDVPRAQRKPVDVVVHVEVSANGFVTSTRVTTPPHPPFDDLAIASVQEWTFLPARKDDKPVAGVLDVAVHFDPRAPTPETIEIVGDAPPGRTPPPSTGAQDHYIIAGKLGTEIPHKTSTELLQWAPGFLLTNEGGDGHAEQIFLRGFDAREGQDIEMRVNDDVINQVGNLHGNGYADVHFILPELVLSLRVVEGPYDPRQGNFAVAGTANYELGLDRRGLIGSYEVGSFNTRRALLLWGPKDRDAHTFGGVELYQTDGFGQNRDARRATALGQFESKLGEHGVWRVTSGAYLSDYHSAGVIREDDFAAFEKGFYDTYDFGQGGAASRAFTLAAIDTHHDETTYHHQISLTGATMRLRENFTGFLLDQQSPFQQAHEQRGDLIDLEASGFTLQAQGYGRERRMIGKLAQEVELGYFARVDLTSNQQYRLRDSNDHPYFKEADIDATLGDIGLYAAANAKLHDKIALRGGVRSDLFTYDVINNCAVHDVAHPSMANPPGDQSCISQEDFGRFREPVQRASTSGAVMLPRAALVLGPFSGFTPSIAVGNGVRSIDPSYITQDVKTPFASIRSYDAGVGFDSLGDEVGTNFRASVFHTHVDKDLIFSETEGRNVLANGTTRLGASLSGRVRGAWFDQNASVTYVRSKFDDTQLLIPYVPDVVIRSDSVVFGDLPWKLDRYVLRGVGGLGITYVGPRALPYGERSDTIFTIDASTSVSWDRYTLGLKGSNLLGTQYRLGEYNFASDFHSQEQPTLTISRHFTAGAPRTLLLHLEVTL